MADQPFAAIGFLLSSASPDDVRRGLADARNAIQDTPQNRIALFEMVAALLYLDALDRPEFAPVLDEAIGTIVSFGPSIIPELLRHFDDGDLKAQIAISHALGRIGPAAVDPLVAQYGISTDTDRRCFILYALGKVRSSVVVKAIPLALDAARSPDRELRDTATRALGKFARAIPPEELPGQTRQTILAVLHANLSDSSPVIRAKAIRSLGKLAKHRHLTAEERASLREVCRRIAGKDEQFDWDRAYIVRLEAEEALRHT